ncbi:MULTISPECIES: GntR family transcriptional regulator [unclassified Crossiella]|uniref:GntR family transcriptional regulator n=1 Tax=unclassified Crossiella TaxID=2620835 RepID=UPI001FFF23C0|nr:MULTISPECIES: GntR family transcriptional regulator [unclassified Crossiella]MCK2243392.1 GntR family transcriptional regulator [Crossiella sp. S99.2]MCK2254139.1 GntR family transcriptional regulator [Crossiella sp. S99.1]
MLTFRQSADLLLEAKVTDTTPLRPADRRGLADEVADRIRAAIFDGAFPPGAPLREVDLAARLEVSRGPIREALAKLEREGLVRTQWHRGATVTTLSAEDAEELYTLREALERLAVARFHSHATPADLAALAEIVDRMHTAATEHDLLRLDLEFHDTVYAATRHDRLNQAWSAIRAQIILFLLSRIAISTDYRHQVPGEHRSLVAALRAGDPRHSTELFVAHLRLAYDRLSGTF